MPNKSQATRCTQAQLAYLAYWQSRGYRFGRDDVIPESTSIPPQQWHMPRAVDLAVTAVILLGVLALMWWRQ